MESPNIPKTMFTWRKDYSSSDPAYIEVPVPSTPDDGLLVKVWAAGGASEQISAFSEAAPERSRPADYIRVCHSDLSILASTAPPLGSQQLEPFTMGHECCGEIVSLGSQVTNFTTGEMVSVVSVPGCTRPDCWECSRGLPQICPVGPKYGLEIDGCFAPYVAVAARAACRLPEGVDPALGAVATDAVTTAYHAVVGRAQAKAGETILLYGLGGLGLNALQILLGLKARVIAFDKRHAVLDDTLALGVDSGDIIPADTTNVAEWITQKGLVIDKVIDFVDTSESVAAAIQVVRRGGTIVLVGMMQDSVPLFTVGTVLKHLDILGSMGGTMEDLNASLDLLAQGNIKPRVEKTKMINFPAVLERLHVGGVIGRMVLIPEGMEDTMGLTST